jgi:predicted NACHT family NTPase
VKALAGIWQGMNLKTLPDDFSWEAVGKRYQRKVKAIWREMPELREILDSQLLEEIAENTRQGIAPGFDLYQYQETIQERYGNLKLESLDTTGYAYNELKLWRMFIPQKVRESQEFLPQVYEIPKEYQRRLREAGELEAELSEAQLERCRKVYTQQIPRSVLEVVKDGKLWYYVTLGDSVEVSRHRNKYLVILGDPGSGKSTLLQYLALEWAELPLRDLPLYPIPLLIELRTYQRNRDMGECQNFLEFVHKSSGWVGHLNQHQLHDWLTQGNAVVMFDGLDEVFDPAKREDVISQIHSFTQTYPQVQVLVTSRIIGYKPQRLRDAEFRHFILQDLETEQITEFIDRWHELTFTDEADKTQQFSFEKM